MAPPEHGRFIVAVLESEDEKSEHLGCGFLFSEYCVFTCRHVAGVTGTTRWLRFPLLEHAGVLKAEVIQSGGGIDDMAVLKILDREQMPAETRPARLEKAPRSRGEDVFVYGIGSASRKGSIVDGTLAGKVEKRRVQIDRKSKNFVVKGFSGTPVMSCSDGPLRVFGMLDSKVVTDRRDKEDVESVGRMIPVEVLDEFFPCLSDGCSTETQNSCDYSTETQDSYSCSTETIKRDASGEYLYTKCDRWPQVNAFVEHANMRDEKRGYPRFFFILGDENSKISSFAKRLVHCELPPLITARKDARPVWPVIDEQPHSLMNHVDTLKGNFLGSLFKNILENYKGGYELKELLELPEMSNHSVIAVSFLFNAAKWDPSFIEFFDWCVHEFFAGYGPKDENHTMADAVVLFGVQIARAGSSGFWKKWFRQSPCAKEEILEFCQGAEKNNVHCHLLEPLGAVEKQDVHDFMAGLGDHCLCQDDKKQCVKELFGRLKSRLDMDVIEDKLRGVLDSATKARSDSFFGTDRSAFRKA